MKISIYKDIKDTKSPHTIGLEQLLQFIKGGRWYDGVNDVRQRLKLAKTKAQKTEIKAKLPNATISGTFSERKNDFLIEHSGFIAIDIDDIKEIDNLKRLICNDLYVYACFVSVSGEGLCVVVKIEPGRHDEAFLALQEYFKHNYGILIDKSCKNVGRTRYVSYDPELYLNKDSNIFDEYHLIKRDVTPKKKKSASKGDIESVVQKVENAGIDITNDYQDWLKIGFALADEFGEDGRNFFHRISAQHPEYDHNETEGKYDSCLRDHRNVHIATLFHIFQQYDIRPDRGDTEPLFYYEEVVGVDKSTGEELTEFKISRTGLIDFLEHHGFGKIISEEQIQFVQVVDNIFAKKSLVQIQDFVNEHTKQLPKEIRFVLLNALYKGVNTYFSEKLLAMLKTYEFKHLKATPDKAFFYFKNGCVGVSKDKIEIAPYSDLKWNLWETQINERVFKPAKFDEYEDNCAFAKFLKLISSVAYEGDELIPVEERQQKHKERLGSIMTITGYLLHEYKLPDRPCAVVLFDQNLSDNPQGGTGKGLYIKAIKQIKNTVSFDGKTFNFQDQFRWQRIQSDTQIVAMEDVERNFEFEKMFSFITDGVPVNRKNKGEVFLDFDEAPKVLITTNYVLEGDGDSHQRRKIEFELGKYFNKQRTPRSEFGHTFFSDWDEYQWNLFDNFMIHCVQCYLSQGIVEVDPILLKRRKLEQEVPEHVLEYLIGFAEREEEGAFFTASEITSKFNLNYNNFKNFTPKTFGRLITAFGNHFDGHPTLLPAREGNKRGYKVKKQAD